MTGKSLRKIVQKIAFNMLYIKEMNIYPAYISKDNFTHEKHIIILMTTNGKRWHYLTVKNLSAILRGLTSKHVCDFYCLIYLNFFRTKSKFESHKKLCKNKDFYGFVMPSETVKY